MLCIAWVILFSGVTGGGKVPPRDFWLDNFCWPIGKKEPRKKGKRVKIEKKRRKIVKEKVENWKWKVEKLQNEERTFFSSHFSKPLKFVLGLPKWKFSTGKKYFRPGGGYSHVKAYGDVPPKWVTFSAKLLRHGSHFTKIAKKLLNQPFLR